MALGNVFIKDVDGNIPYQTPSDQEKVTGLLFDTSLQPQLFAAGYGKNNENKLRLNDVVYVTSRKSSVNDFGIIARVDVADPAEENNENFLHGIPAYHIREFFRMSGNVDGTGKLYVMFADCSSDWDAIDVMQRAAGGTISQLGVWTEQPLWKLNGDADKYNLNLVMSLHEKAEAMASQNQPLSIVLCANPSNTGALTTVGKQIDLNKVPSAVCNASRVSVIFGQAASETVSTMQKRNINNTPVGFLGAFMGAVARANVQESVAWVKQFNLFSDDFQEIELGFGDINLDPEDEFLSLNMYESLSPVLLDELDDKGYIFPIKYAGRENGIYISRDQTCSHGDFRTIARNRTINKSRRQVRAALLPYVNSPLMVNPSTGYLAASKITAFKTLVGDILAKMQAAQEISGYAVTIDASQNVLVHDTLKKALGEVRELAAGIKVTVNPGKALSSKQLKKNAGQIIDQSKGFMRDMVGTTHTAQTSLTRSIGKINSAFTHLQKGREINIKTDIAKARLQEILGLLGQVRGSVSRGMQLSGGVARGPINAARVPFAHTLPATYQLPKAAADKLNARLATGHALQQQRLAHIRDNAAAKIEQQAKIESARAQRQHVVRAARQQDAETERTAALQQKAARDAERMRQKQAVQAVRGHIQTFNHSEGMYSRTRQGAINRLQYSRPPALRTMIPFGYMLNGYMLLSTMKRQITEAVEYANIMESARSILRVADDDLGTFESRFKKMAMNVRQVGVETKFTAVQVAGAVKFLAMAGQNIDTINKSIRPITNLALIGDNDLETIADLTTNIMAGYDISPESMPTVADVIASTISRSNVNIIETAESFKMAAGTLRMAGIDFTEASAAIGLLGNMGLKGTMSGTSLRAIATRLSAQPKSARDAIERLGIDFKEKVNVYGNEIERFRPLSDIFEDLAKAGATLEDMHKIFGVRGANAGMMFLQNYGKLRELTSQNRASQGISAELAAVKQQTTKGLWYQTTSMLTETFMQGYEIMEPEIQRVLRLFLAKFDGDKFARGLASLGGALLDVMRMLANLATWFAANFNWLGPLFFSGFVGTKVFKLAGAITNLGVALGFLGRQSAAEGIIAISASFGIEGRIVGRRTGIRPRIALHPPCRSSLFLYQIKLPIADRLASVSR